MSSKRQEIIRIDDEKRRRLTAYLDGFRAGSSLGAIINEQDTDYMDGWRVGKAAFRKAQEEAQTKYGIRFEVLKLQ